MGLISVLLVTKENDIIELTCLGVTKFYNANEDKVFGFTLCSKRCDSFFNCQSSVKCEKDQEHSWCTLFLGDNEEKKLIV